MYAVFFAFAALLLILIPLAPKLLRLRIRVLRWLRWDWGADLLERRFDGWVLFLRILLFGIAIVLFFVGWRDLSG
jgi:hypothetical protein